MNAGGLVMSNKERTQNINKTSVPDCPVSYLKLVERINQKPNARRSIQRLIKIVKENPGYICNTF